MESFDCLYFNRVFKSSFNIKIFFLNNPNFSADFNLLTQDYDENKKDLKLMMQQLVRSVKPHSTTYQVDFLSLAMYLNMLGGPSFFVKTPWAFINGSLATVAFLISADQLNMVLAFGPNFSESLAKKVFAIVFDKPASAKNEITVKAIRNLCRYSYVTAKSIPKYIFRLNELDDFGRATIFNGRIEPEKHSKRTCRKYVEFHIGLQRAKLANETLQIEPFDASIPCFTLDTLPKFDDFKSKKKTKQGGAKSRSNKDESSESNDDDGEVSNDEAMDDPSDDPSKPSTSKEKSVGVFRIRNKDRLNLSEFKNAVNDLSVSEGDVSLILELLQQAYSLLFGTNNQHLDSLIYEARNKLEQLLDRHQEELDLQSRPNDPSNSKKRHYNHDDDDD